MNANELNKYTLSEEDAKSMIPLRSPECVPYIFPDNVTYNDPETQDLYNAEFVGFNSYPYGGFSTTYRVSRCISFDKYESAIAVINSDKQLELLNSNIKEFWDKYVEPRMIRKDGNKNG